MLTLSGIKYGVTEEFSEERLKERGAKKLRVSKSRLKDFHISKKSIDARNKADVHYVYSVSFSIADEEKYLRLPNVSKAKEYRLSIPKRESSLSPVVVGFGPGGMFAALILAKAGLKPIVIERGRAVEQRRKDIDKFWQTGVLDTASNVQFGEGGAGTFSDGKLNTGKNDPLIYTVFSEFVKAGAPKEIMYLSKPHIGTDNLIKVVGNIREQIKALGGQVLFEHQMTDIHTKGNRVCGIVCQTPKGEKHIDCSALILALGHSARDTFQMIVNKGILTEQKPFAMGVRIEHSQEMIDRAQYGRFAKYLPPADYKLAAHLPNGRGVYTFCMCPGGYVVAAASEEKRLVTNGMSYFARNGSNSNAALLVGLNPSDFGGDDQDPLAGVYFQRELEHRAYIAGGGNYYAPVQLTEDMLNNRASTALGSVAPTYRPGVTPTDLRQVFPDYMYEALRDGILALDKQLKGFAHPEGVLTAVESRSSSPLRIVRDGKTLESLSLKGLYPCGEGCGYAGGITSAAADGIRCALAAIEKNNFSDKNK